MKFLQKYIKVTLFLAATICLCMHCKKEDYYKITYYDAIGEGYVFRSDSLNNLTPVPSTTVWLRTELELELPAQYIDEALTTDSNGMYQVRFIKRTKRQNSVRYIIRLQAYKGPGGVGDLLF